MKSEVSKGPHLKTKTQTPLLDSKAKQLVRQERSPNHQKNKKKKETTKKYVTDEGAS